MPNNIIAAVPTDVMPAHLSRAFHEERHLECDLNLYPDGSSDRKPLAGAGHDRRYFTMQQSLLPTEWQALRTFYFAHQGRPFYFYNPRETVPPFHFDPSGMDPIGRYIVVFDGQWSEVYGYRRAQAANVSLGLREVA